MRIEFTYTRGPDHFAGFASPAERSASPIPSYLIAAVLGLAGAAIAVAAVVDDAPQAATCGVGGLLLGVGIAVAARQRGRGRFVMPATAMEPRRWVISDEGVEIAHADNSVTVAWPAFRTMMALSHAYVFVLKDPADRRTIDIPRRPLTEADDAAVRELVARHGITFYSRPVGA
ncbi:hypothetical protein ODJ79_35610 [Actinoplanes sp. KI2]|uniref:hypothetical protein n=1 Tax=Actinoplanes sp. KI2 TaxID=2983315 RepID=UPI0021D58166|nr:hypothetical protein [Actinoplanes sp. KI2]MCU7729071.1 hypothetical protein [Actinoplanes sp. KI2]